MATILFGWPLVSDSATLSGGSWLSGLPLTNLKTNALGTVARSSTDSNADTIINVDCGAASAISVVALVRHNLRSAAQWRIRGGSDVTFATSSYDSGTVNVWSYQWAVGSLPSGHPNASSRLLTDAQIDALNPKRDAVLVLPTEVSARYWRIEIFDSSNADNYVEIGRLVMAPRYQPSYNFSPGAEFGFVDGTVAGRSLSGVRFYDARPKARTLSLQFDVIADAEATTVLRDLLEQVGTSEPLYVVTDPSDTVNLQRRSFLANVRQLSGVRYASAGYSSLPIVLDEVI